MSDETSSTPSIEFLGQKFSYPKTWQGTASVLIVCSTIGFVAWTLEPEQINSYKGFFVSETSQEVEEELVSLNKQLNSQVTMLKNQLLRLSQQANLKDAEKKALVSEVTTADKSINQSYAALIKKQKERQNELKASIQISTQNLAPTLLNENVRLNQQLRDFKLQRSVRQPFQ